MFALSYTSILIVTFPEIVFYYPEVYTIKKNSKQRGSFGVGDPKPGQNLLKIRRNCLIIWLKEKFEESIGAQPDE